MINKRTKTLLLNTAKASALPLIILVLFSVITRIIPGASTSSYGTYNHIMVILKQAAPALLMALGMSFNMFSGRWDFSYGSISVVSAIVGGQLAEKWGLSSFSMMFVCIVVSCACTTVSGLIYINIKLPALVVSLGLVQVYEMISAMIYDGAGATVRGAVTNLAILPNIVIFTGIAFVLYYIIINKTKFGYDVRSIGGGQEIARNIGVNVKRNAFLCYFIGGIFIGMSAYMTICSNGTQRATLNLESMPVMFDAMICIIIGSYIKRYCNVAFSVLIGVLSMKLLISGLLMIGLSSQMQSIVKGLFLLIFIAFSKNQYKIQERRELKEKAERANAKYAASSGGN